MVVVGDPIWPCSEGQVVKESWEADRNHTASTWVPAKRLILKEIRKKNYLGKQKFNQCVLSTSVYQVVF